MKTLVLANQKGGVGKSAITTQLAHYLHRQSLSVLVIDLDHQQNTSRPLRANPNAAVAAFSSSALFQSPDLLELPTARFILVPGDDGLSNLEKQPELHNAFATRLRSALKAWSRFDVCIIDTNPNPDIRYASALISADYVLVPIQLNQESIEGVAGFFGHSRYGITRIKATLNPALAFLGILPNMVEPTPFQRSNLAMVAATYGTRLLTANAETGTRFGFIPKRSAIAEAQAAGVFLPDLQKSAAREAWREIKPVFDMILSQMNLLPRDGAVCMTIPTLNLAALDAADDFDLTGGTGRPLSLRLDLIHEDPNQPRKTFDDVRQVELNSSVAEAGVRVPISVRPHPTLPGHYMLNFGARRRRAAISVGLAHIPAWVDELQSDYDQVIENLQRDDLKPMEVALFIANKQREGSKLAEIARRLGLTRPAVQKFVALIDPPMEVEEVYTSGRCQSPETLYDLRNVFSKHAAETRAWLATDVEITRRSVEQFKKRLDGATEANSAQKAPESAESAPARAPASHVDQGHIRRPIVVVKIGARHGHILLTVRASKENHVRVKWDDTAEIEELPTYKLRLVRVDDARRYEPLNRGLTTSPAPEAKCFS